MLTPLDSISEVHELRPQLGPMGLAIRFTWLRARLVHHVPHIYTPHRGTLTISPTQSNSSTYSNSNRLSAFLQRNIPLKMIGACAAPVFAFPPFNFSKLYYCPTNRLIVIITLQTIFYYNKFNTAAFALN